MKMELLRELEEKFKELDLRVNLEELDIIFFIKDFILTEGFVSENLSRQICSRISDTYGSWVNYLNGILVPNPSYMPIQAESKPFSSKEEREKIWELIKKAMELVSRNIMIGLTKDKEEEGKFIEEAVSFWNNKFKKELIRIMKKTNKQWKESK